MRKLFALALALTLVSGLYGVKLGLGVSYEGLAVDSVDAYLAIKADVRVPLFSMIDVRACLLNVELPENLKALAFGTFVDSDLMFKFPMGGNLKPYLAIGVWFGKSLESGENAIKYTSIQLKGALGAEMAFGGMDAYLEGGLNKFESFKVGDFDATTKNPIYVQLGVTFPVGQ